MLKDMSHLDKQLEQRQLEASKKNQTPTPGSNDSELDIPSSSDDHSVA